MMKLKDKIRQIRKEQGLSLRGLERRLKEIFGAKALRYNTLYRIEKGLRQARVSSLSQISTGLGISLKDLKQNTERDTESAGRRLNKNENLGQYVYSEKSQAQILTSEQQPFLVLKLTLEPQGRTSIERDPIEVGKFEKFVYVLRGKITCVIDQKKLIVSKDGSLCFDSTLPHHFENNTSSRAVCIIYQNPRHI